MTTTKKSPILDFLSKLASGGRNLTGSELSELIQKAQDEHSQVAVREREELKEQITQLATEKGFDLGDIQALFATRYVNPANPFETWSGKGQRPKWIKDLEAQGYDKEKFREGPAPVSGSNGKSHAVSSAASRVQRTYRNPADPSQTYSRGPHPPWFKALKQKKGVNLNDYLV